MADSKVTALTELTSAAGSDVLYIVDDPAGTPLSKKITVANLKAAMGGDVFSPFVKESTATTGTGTISLAGAETGYVGFVEAFGSGAQVYYLIEDGNNRESGFGTVTDSSPDTLSRDLVLETVVSGTHTLLPGTGITLSGSAYVSVGQGGASVGGINVPGPLSATYRKMFHGGYDASDSTSETGGTIRYTPFSLTSAKLITYMALEVATSASVTWYMGIYDSDEDGLPNNKLADCSVSASTTGLKEATLSTALKLKPGLYYTAAVATTSGSAIKHFIGGEVGWYYTTDAFYTASSLSESGTTLPSTAAPTGVSSRTSYLVWR